jgi:hypothetical protein
MKEKMKNCKKSRVLMTFLVAGVFAVWFSILVGAISIGSPGAVNLEPGSSSETSFSILNKGESAEDVVVEVVVEEGSEYITFLDGTTFDVPAGQVASVPTRISVPASANVGDQYKVTIVFVPLEGGEGSEGGTVDLTFGFKSSFNVNVVEKITEEGVVGEESVEEGEGVGTGILWWILGLVVLILIIWWLVAKSKSKQTI